MWRFTILLQSERFRVHPRMVSLFLPVYFPFLNPIEEVLSSWRWKVYDQQACDQISLLDTMNGGYLDISAEDFQGWISKKMLSQVWMRTCGQKHLHWHSCVSIFADMLYVDMCSFTLHTGIICIKNSKIRPIEANYSISSSFLWHIV